MQHFTLKALLLPLLLLLGATYAMAQVRAITSDGDEVMLYPNGTWEYINRRPNPYDYQEPPTAVGAGISGRHIGIIVRRQLLVVLRDGMLEDVIIYEPQGCPLCNDTGYAGRIGVYEMMPVSRALQAVIASGATADVIEKQALKEGMLTLKMGAAKHVLDGITSIAEMNKIVHSTVTVAEGVDMG